MMKKLKRMVKLIQECKDKMHKFSKTSYLNMKSLRLETEKVKKLFIFNLSITRLLVTKVKVKVTSKTNQAQALKKMKMNLPLLRRSSRLDSRSNQMTT